MKRQGSRLRRRYGRAVRGRIEFGKGIVPTASIHLTPGHVYAMGASSSPALVEVIHVTGDHIRYRKHGQFGDTSEKVIERWIGEDLIAQGERMFASRYGVSPQVWIGMSEDERRHQLKGRL